MAAQRGRDPRAVAAALPPGLAPTRWRWRGGPRAGRGADGRGRRGPRRAERAPASALVGPFVPTVGRQWSELANVEATIAFIRAVLASRTGDAERAEAYARQALGHLTEDDRQLRVVAQAMLVEAAWTAGRLDIAEHLAESSIVDLQIDDRAGDGDAPAVRPGPDPVGPRAVAQPSRRTDAPWRAMTPSGAKPLPGAGLQSIGLAEVLRQRGDLDRAAPRGRRPRACHQIVSTEPAAAGLATLAWIQYGKGDHVARGSCADEVTERS